MIIFSSFARSAGVLALATALLGSALAPSAPSFAAEPVIRNHRDPFARIVIELKRIIIHKDMEEWGDSEINMRYEVRTDPSSTGCPADITVECGTAIALGAIPQFSGKGKQVDRVVPSYLDTIPNGSDATSAFGIPIRPGQWYGITVTGYEDDPVADDNLGVLKINILDSRGNVRFGTHTERGSGECEGVPVLEDMCNRPEKTWGAFSVEYEIRPAPLPDLQPVGIAVYELPGSSTKLVCPAIKNDGSQDAGPFEMVLRVDRTLAPVAKASAGRLGAGEQGDLCVEATLPVAGEHQLTVAVDEADAQIEVDETNNTFSQPYVAGPITTPQGGPGTATDAEKGSTGTPSKPSASPEPRSPMPTPDPSKSADLSTSAIRVNGQSPDGKNDCKEGKNGVAVVVKNGGQAGAGSFVVRLTVDGEQVGEESVSGLEAGKEREVRFGEVRLKKGEHKVSATVDSKGTVAESNEENNERTVGVACKDGGQMAPDAWCCPTSGSRQIR